MGSNLQHTPGPWSFEGPEHSIIVWGSEPGQRICFMTSDGPAIENARLIATAPAMAARIAELEAALSAATAAREAAEAKAARLEEALEPFAKHAGDYEPPEGDDDQRIWGDWLPTIGDLRRARAALEA